VLVKAIRTPDIIASNLVALVSNKWFKVLQPPQVLFRFRGLHLKLVYKDTLIVLLNSSSNNNNSNNNSSNNSNRCRRSSSSNNTI
jgi:hypothetical protein